MLTYITEALVVIASFWLYKIILDKYDQQSFSLYSILKRVLAFIIPALALGNGVGIPRFIAINSDKEDSIKFLISGLIISFLGFIFFCLLLYLKTDLFSNLIFGSENFSYLANSILLLVLSLLIHALVYSYYRGLMDFNSANFLQIINVIIIPFTFIFIIKDFNLYLRYSSLTVTFFTLFFAISTNIRNISNVKIISIKKTLKMLFNYGIQRVPGDIILGLLFLAPVSIFAYQTSEIKIIGNLAFIISISTMFSAAFGPISLILLPVTSKAIKKNKSISKIKNNIYKILIISIILSVLAMGFIILFRDFIFYTFLEIHEIKNLFEILIITGAGIIGYVSYIVLRSVLDAIYEKAFNSLNVLYSVIFFIVSLCFLHFVYKINIIEIVSCFSLSLALLGILSVKTTAKYFNSIR